MQKFEFLEVKRIPVDVKSMKKRTALETDTQQCISRPTVFTEGGKPLIVYGLIDHPLVENLRQVVRRIKYSTSDRTDGLVSTSRTFGYLPRVTIRRDFCTACSLAKESPKEHADICEFGRYIAGIYRQQMPEAYGHQMEILKKEVRDHWVIPETPFTSGIVNKNNPLNYHFDAGNYNGLASCMVVFRNLLGGGNLSIPELGLKISLADKSYVIFDGQSLLHGVTPIKLLNKNGYRYTLVYYALKAMRNCLSAEEECQRIRKVKRGREKRRLDGTVADLGPE